MPARRRLLLAVPAALVAAAVCAASAAAHGVPGAVTHRDTRTELPAGSIAATAAAAAAPAALPSRWCGDALTRDDVDHAALPATAPQFKFVYAHPADRPDRFAGWRDALQANVALIQRFLASQTGGAKALRVDMGTRCGPQYVDLQVVHLRATRASYVDNFDAIVREVDERLGAPAGPRNVVILADTLNGGGHDYGLGETVLGPGADRKGAANVHNRGGFASILFSRDGQPAPGADPRGWWPEGFLHEMTHNLGGVQWSAPHSTQPPGFQLYRYGHCWQGADVMCYVEDAGAAHPMRYDCPRVGGVIPQAYDCGRDDYFNPAPPPGSYLARHWNVYESAFLGPCREVAPACGGGTAGLAPTPPVSTASPTVAGAPRPGTVLRAAPGGWRNGPLSYAYRWQRERRGEWADITGAAQAIYVPRHADVGRQLRVQVIATNPDGSAAAASPPSARVAASAVGRDAAQASRRCRRGKRGTAAKRRRSARRTAAGRAGGKAAASRKARRTRKGAATGRARRPAARCRGRRTSKRASARDRSPRRRTSASARARQRDRASRSAR